MKITMLSDKKLGQLVGLLIILLVGLVVRLYKIDTPLADWHSWRQADTAAVARNFFQEGFNPFIPKYDDMSSQANGYDNPNRYRFVEFPIYNSLVYFAYLINGRVDIRLARLISIMMSLGSVVFIFLIVRRYFGRTQALMASLVQTILPFNIYFSRVILPESTLVFFCLGMFYFVDRWIAENSRKLGFLSILFTICAFLIKPMAIFYLLPLTYSFYQKEGKFWPIPKRYLVFLILSFMPLLLWRIWMNFFPEGIPASSWLFNGNGIRFRPAFWRWIVGDRFGREILTVTGTALFLIGVLKKYTPKEGALLYLLLLSSLAYLAVFATGNVQHDYYQVLIVPALAIFLARGFILLIQGVPGFLPRLYTIPLALLLFILTIYFGWNEAKGLYQINNGAIVEAGDEANMILPKEAKIVAPYNGDTAFLYQTNRPGFPILTLPIEEMKKKYGITHYVSVNFDNDTNKIIQKYTVLEKNPRFVIVDVTKENH